MLREISRPLANPGDARLLLRDLDATLQEFRRTHGFGRGISAVQIGEPLRVIFLRVEGVEYEMVNPSYEWQSEGTFRLWDDCFSFPDLMVYLERAEAVRVQYWTGSGKEQVLEARGALSELIQHEMDHLDGILAVDRALGADGFATREEWLRRHHFAASSS